MILKQFSIPLVNLQKSATQNRKAGGRSPMKCNWQWYAGHHNHYEYHIYPRLQWPCT